MRRTHRFSFSWAIVLLLWSTVCIVSANADPITFTPGTDFFSTPPGSTATFTTPGGPVTVTFQGVPLNAALANTDTTVARLTGGSVTNGGPPLVVPIQITALQLQSTAPVSIGGSSFNVFVALTPTIVQPLGSMSITESRLNEGGTFDSTLPVDATATFTQVGNPANSFTAPFSDVFTTTGTDWSIIPTPGYPGANGGSGGFEAGDNAGKPAPFSEAALLASHGVGPAIVTPEPSNLLLLGFGLAGFALIAIKKVQV